MLAPAFAVLRVEKLKGGKVAEADGHNRRTIPVPHRDPDGKFERLIGDPNADLDDLIQHRIAATGAKLRKDGVPAIEIMFGASPEYFRPDTPEAWGVYDEKRMEAWRDAAEKWAREKYGDNLITLDLHLDEGTPHAHAIVTPITTKMRKRRGKDEHYEQAVFDAKGMFGKQALRDLQTDYANAIKHLGIHRGLKKSGRNHEDVKEFYKDASTGNVIIPNLPPVKVEKPPRLLTNEARENYKKEQDKKVEKILSNWGDNLKKKTHRVMRLAKHYQRKYLRERARTLKYWEQYGSPENLESTIQQQDKLNEALKDQLIEERKKVEKLSYEKDAFYVPNDKYIEDVREAEKRVRAEMQEKVENKQRELMQLRAHYRNRSGRDLGR